jgi:hypothetical protein
LPSDAAAKLGQVGGESSAAGNHPSQSQQPGPSAGLMGYGMGDVGTSQSGSGAFGDGSAASGTAGDALGGIGGEFGNFVFDGSALDQYFLPDSGDGNGPSDGSGGGGGNGFGVDDWNSFSVFGDQ